MKTLLKDQPFLAGLICILLSAFVFMLPEISVSFSPDKYFQIFFVNYFFAAGYILYLLIRGAVQFKWKFYRIPARYVLLYLVLAMISAFALNREIPVFNTSAHWLSLLLVVQCAAFVLFCFIDLMPLFVQHILYFIIGVGCLVFLYFSIALTSLYVIGVIGSFFLGLSLHVFIPGLFLIYTGVLVYQGWLLNRRLLYSFCTGAFCTLVFTGYFVYQWNSVCQKIDHCYNSSMVSNTTDLPSWVKVSQQVPANWVTERVIKSDLVYSTPDMNGNWFWSMPRTSFDEVKRHDPLVMVAAMLCGKPSSLNEEEKIKILESLYDSRHQAQERLWRGENLITSGVLTNIKIWPGYRMAYTEKIITVNNTIPRTSWRGQQEAIYTFHLPEGSAVTSLSLWIDGKEVKGRLTARGKADSAYKTIVGVEARDPSVVHWQEGNTVTARIFPVTPQEPRRFKIGVTSPLALRDNRLVYENIYFDGPDAARAGEDIFLDMDQEHQQPAFPFPFSREGKGWTHSGAYTQDWSLTLSAPPVEKGVFSFNGKGYSVEDCAKVYADADIHEVYLDINSSWTDKEITDVFDLVKSNDVYVYSDKLLRLKPSNLEAASAQLRKLNYSMFPVFRIKDPAHALLISKSNGASPNIADLKESGFERRLAAFLKNSTRIKFFNLGGTVSPYLKTLREFRVFDSEEGDVAALGGLLYRNRFPVSQESGSVVVIPGSRLKIKESSDSFVGRDVPSDHLLRLFAYNDILKQVNKTLLTHEETDGSCVVEEAKQSYVVSPVSSLIVLETRDDYDRFGIEEGRNSLKNASMGGSGSVPEPYEWMLIGVMILVVLYVRFRN